MSEAYDPVADRWLPAKEMGTARFRHAVTQLPGGEVVATGGQLANEVLVSVEIATAAP